PARNLSSGFVLSVENRKVSPTDYFSVRGARQRHARKSSRSEKNIEVEHSSPTVVAKEGAIQRIGNVRVHLERIEMIGQITDCARKAHCVFRVDLNIFRNSQVEREISRETVLRTIARIQVLLKFVGRLVGKAVTKLHMRHQQDLSWKSVRAPQQKPIGNFTWQSCYETVAYHRERVVSEVRVGVADGTIGILSNIRKEKLAIGSRPDPRRKLGLSRVRLAGVTEHKRVLFLNHFRLQRDHILFVALQVFHAQQ